MQTLEKQDVNQLTQELAASCDAICETIHYQQCNAAENSSLCAAVRIELILQLQMVLDRTERSILNLCNKLQGE